MNNGQVKLFDFGMAREVDSITGKGIGAEYYKSCGTPIYMAPEVLKGGGGSKKSDVYSFGIVLHEICSLKTPFRDGEGRRNSLSAHSDFVCAGGRPGLNIIPNQDVRDLITECIGHPDERPSFVSIANFRLDEIITRKAQRDRKKDTSKKGSSSAPRRMSSLGRGLSFSFRSETSRTSSASIDSD